RLVELSQECDRNMVWVNCNVFIQNIGGVKYYPNFDFAIPSDLTDTIFLVEGKQVHVNSQYLGLISPVFNAMFFGSFDEKNKREIELKDVKHEEFVQLLNVIYPSFENVTGYSVYAVLKLADRFQIKYAMDRAEEYLIGDMWPLAETYQFSDQFRLRK
ncbi:hypothetical protein PFISCL1PPCAC_20716, partial [Pristionchus fissidentatus]